MAAREVVVINVLLKGLDLWHVDFVHVRRRLLTVPSE